MSDRISELAEKIRQYDYEYYVRSAPSIGDREYDHLFDELQRLEEQFPELIRTDSPSQRIGSDLTNTFPEIAHTIPVLSLDKAYSMEEIQVWITRCSRGMTEVFHLTIEEKMDGSSLVLYYEKGILVRALTRGNGEQGNDITQNVRTIHSIPLRLNTSENVAIRGEVYIGISDFEKIRSTRAGDYANPRNFASGSLRRIKSSELGRIPLRFFAYDLHGQNFTRSHTENMRILASLGMPVNPHQKTIAIQPGDTAKLSESLKHIENFITGRAEVRAKLNYEIDGMVIKIDEMPLRDRLGSTGHHPRWAIAYKFESPQGITIVQGIDIQVGRTGRVTPVARVKPVFVGGTTIRNVTLHNQDYIHALGLAVGDTVSVSRRGDVIPAVECVLEKGNEISWDMPPACPFCSGILRKDGAHHFCPNFDCPARKKGRIIFFTGRNQMDIENLGSETVAALIDEGIIQDIPDIFCLDYDRIRALPGFGEKKVQLIREGVEKALTQPYRRIMISLGISDFGPKLAELLEEHSYRSIASLFTLLDAHDERSLTDIKGIGEKTVQTISQEMREPRFRDMIDRLTELGLVFTADDGRAGAEDTQIGGGADRGAQIGAAQIGAAQIFSSQRWCVTGSFEAFKPRSLAIEEIKKRGGDVTSDVTGKTTHLLAGNSAGSKLAKAQKLGIAIVHENEFITALKEEK